MEEWKIGEIGQVNGEWYQCILAIQGCRECSFRTQGSCARLPECVSKVRSDGKPVIFKKLEKVGEPIIYMSRTFQRLKSPDTKRCEYCYFRNQVCNPGLCGEESFLVEVKQNKKEDMEEKKIQLKQEDIDYLTRKIRYLVCTNNVNNAYDRATEEIMNLFIPSDTEHSSSEKIGKNLKPFDLEAAKAGKPVYTRDGRKARIICVDVNNDKPIVAVICCKDGKETYPYTFYPNGLNMDNNVLSNTDLMMLPEKKEGWILLRKDGYTFDNEEAAKKNCTDEQFVAKVEWEE